MPHPRPQRLASCPCINSSVEVERARRGSGWARLFALLAAAVLGVISQAQAEEPAAPTAKTKTHRLQVIVDAMREDLGVTHEVSVELVPSNPLRASVEPVKNAVKGAAKTFRLTIERGFHDQLTEEELRAVIAHELGHVWIYTHHPFLQTEQQANQIALKIVSRGSLEKVYGKVWAAGGAGTLPRFPDERPPTELGVARPQDQPQR